jgi:chromosome segregation ATPase
MSAKGYEEYLLLRRSVEELMSEHDKLVELAAGLRNELSDVRRQLAEKNEEVKELQARYERAKFSGAILGSGEDATTARRRMSELVREIDKCIALLDR